MYPHNGGGGRIKGSLDAHTFEVLARALEALRKPPGDSERSLAERDADALGELCTNSLDEGQPREQGGERPHVLLVISLEQLRKNRGTVLEYGGQLSAALTRMLLCTSGGLRGAEVSPVILDRGSRSPGTHRGAVATLPGPARSGCGRRRIRLEIGLDVADVGQHGLAGQIEPV